METEFFLAIQSVIISGVEGYLKVGGSLSRGVAIGGIKGLLCTLAVFVVHSIY